VKHLRRGLVSIVGLIGVCNRTKENLGGMKHRKLIRLSIYSLASLGLYILLAWRYPLMPSLENPRASWASMVDPTLGNASLHILIYLGLTLLYIAMLRLLTPTSGETESHLRLEISLIIGAWLACSGVLLAVAPAGESHDIFDYTFRGRMMTVYHANPLVDVPDSYPVSTPYSRFLAWRKHVDTYGPIWEASSAAISSGVRQVARWLHWWNDIHPVCPKSPRSCRLLAVYITGYRLFAISLTGLSGWLIFSIVRYRQPALTPMASAAWLLSPMTLIATALGGHNDALMLVLVLLCWWSLQRKRVYLALLALILAAHVKLTALIWLPVCALWILSRLGRKQTLKVGLASAASGLTLSWLLYAPFGGWGSLPRMLQERSEFLANSPWRIFNFLALYYWKWPTDIVHQLSVNLPSWLFIISVILVSLWMFNFRPKRWRQTSIDSEESQSTLWCTLQAISVLYLIVGSFWFQHWYVLWILAPAALLPNTHFTRVILPWLAFGALSANVTMDFLLNTVLEGSRTILKYIWPVAIIWGPILIAFILSIFLQRRKGAKASLTASRQIVQE